VAAQVVARLQPLREGRQEVSLRLDPPDLGTLRIDATLQGRRLTLQIAAEHDATRSLLEGALPRLRDSLAAHGFVTERVTVQLGVDSFPRRSLGEGHQAFQPSWLSGTSADGRRAPRVRSRGPVSTYDGVDVWV
jgi:flagellar hook-length control protein FliK